MRFVDIIIFIWGAYILYQAGIMWSTQEIPSGMFLEQGETLPKGADVKGFISYMLWKTALTGVVGCLSGILGFFGKLHSMVQMAATVASVMFFVVLILFLFWNKNARKKYLS